MFPLPMKMIKYVEKMYMYSRKMILCNITKMKVILITMHV